MGLPVLPWISLVSHAVVITPVGPLVCVASWGGLPPFPFASDCGLPRLWRVGFHVKPFEACSTFTRVTACELAESLATRFLEGSGGFVTSP